MRVVPRFALWSAAGLAMTAAGCASAPDVPTYPAPDSLTTAYRPARPMRPAPDPSPLRPAAAIEPAPVPAHVDLDALLSLARAHNPDLAAAAARVEEARGRMVQAGLYPNPTVGYSGQEINAGPGTAGQQGGFVSQEFVTGGKLRIAREAARFGVTAADWHAASQWFNTAARVKASYYEYATAVAVERETDRMSGLFAEALARTEKLAAGGKVEGYDVSRLKVEVGQISNRLGAARRRTEAARRMLAVAVGVERLPADVPAGALPDAVTLPGFDEAAGLAGRSSFVLAAAAEAEQARVEVHAAEVKPVPNVQVMAMAMHDAVDRAPMGSVQVGLPIPVWDRNQGNIISARARLQTAMAGVEQARLRQIERLSTAYQRYGNARCQLELYRRRVLPEAAAALEQIDRVYAVRGERFYDTLDARRVLSQARIEYAESLGDLWAAAAEIEAVIQQGGGWCSVESPQHYYFKARNVARMVRSRPLRTPGSTQ
jgi:cobalt-zinc-cadmium efflux system outer membrane protein